jgi:lysophospholipase L1-like esterase
MKVISATTTLLSILLPFTTLLGADLPVPMPMPSPLTAPAGVNTAVYPAPRLDWVDRVNADNAAAAQLADTIQLVFDGDSITDWWKKPSMGTRDSGLQIWNDRYAKLGAFDFAIAGDKTQSLLWRLAQGQMKGIHPKLILLMIGTNNLSSNTNEEIAAGIKAILNEYRRLCPDAVILLQGIFPRTAEASHPLRARIKEINKMIAGYADGKKVLFLDFGDKFLQPDGTLSAEIMPDFLHPNGNGYRIWADAIQPTIDQFFPPSK